MAEAELTALRESFLNQSVLLKRLRAELEEERTAAASGAEEALSMIMRLQEEKAAQNLEACQYKRMAEEKLQHAEESMAFLNEAIFQKGLENASLKFQVHDYKQKLLTLGIKDCDLELKRSNAFPWLKKGSSSAFPRKPSLNRNISLPAIRLEEILSEIDATDKFGSLLPDRQASPSENSECPKQILDDCNTNKIHMEGGGMMEEYDTNKVHNFLREFKEESLYANKTLQRLLTPKRYKENDRTTYDDKSRTETVEHDCSWNPSGDYSDNSTFLLKINEEYPRNRSAFTSLRRHVARTRSYGNGLNPFGIQKISEIEDSQNGAGFCEKYDEMLQDPISKSKSINTDPSSLQKTSISASYKNKSTKQHEDGFLTEGSSRRVSCPTDIEELQERMQRLEDSVRSLKKEDQGSGKDQFELLKRVVELFDSIGTLFEMEMPKFGCHQDNDCSLPLVEAMQYFWL